MFYLETAVGINIYDNHLDLRINGFIMKSFAFVLFWGNDSQDKP